MGNKQLVEMTREETLRSMFDATGFGLEIGPSYNPLLPKAMGYNVETADHASAAELRSKYETLEGAEAKIEEVDYILDGRPIVDVIGHRGRYDFIFASHVIEHMPDIVRFLQSCQALLKESGVLVLAVPDKRFCFDTFRPLSSVGSVVQAFMESRARHTTETIFDYLFYYAKRGHQDVWIERDTHGLHLAHSLDEVMRRVDASANFNGYTDAHAWVFVPESFSLIVGALRSMGMIGFQIADLRKYEGVTCKHEFYVVLKKSGDIGFDYLSQLTKTEAELAEISH
jgi:predicted SAM-dependent methyltransferase